MGAPSRATRQNEMVIVACAGGTQAIWIKDPRKAGRGLRSASQLSGAPGERSPPPGSGVRSATRASVLLNLYLLGLLGSFYTYLVGETIANFFLNTFWGLPAPSKRVLGAHLCQEMRSQNSGLK